MSGSYDAPAEPAPVSADASHAYARTHAATQQTSPHRPYLVPPAGRASQEAMNTMNIMTTTNVTSARRPRRLPVSVAVQPRAQLTVRVGRGNKRGHGSSRGRCLDGRSKQPTQAVTEKLAATARERRAR